MRSACCKLIELGSRFVQDPSSRVMCITFGAPPSSRVSASLFPTLSPLFWNFLIVDSGDMATRTSTASSSSNSEVYIAATEAAHGNCNAAAIDIWPAVMTTVPPPAEMSGPHEWQMAVKDVMASFREYQQSPEAEIQNAANKLQHELQRFTLSTGASCTLLINQVCCMSLLSLSSFSHIAL